MTGINISIQRLLDYFLITFFGLCARSASVFLFFCIFSSSFIISTDDLVSALSNLCICSKQASFSYRKTGSNIEMKNNSFTSVVFDPIQSLGTINLKFLI